MRQKRKRILIGVLAIVFAVGFYFGVVDRIYIERVICFSARTGDIVEARGMRYMWFQHRISTHKQYRVAKVTPTIYSEIFRDPEAPFEHPQSFRPFEWPMKPVMATREGYLTGQLIRTNLMGMAREHLLLVGFTYRRGGMGGVELFRPLDQTSDASRGFVEFLKQKDAETSGTIRRLQSSFINFEHGSNPVWDSLVAEYLAEE